jgi:LCP family protein required for cell wall assembly
VSKPQKNAKKTKKTRYILTGLAFSTVAFLSATVGAILAVSMSSTPLRQVQLTPLQAGIFRKKEAVSYKNLNLPQLSRPIHILVLGTKVLTSEAKESHNLPAQGYHALTNSFEGLADTILLLRFDPGSDRLTLLSIPRDTQAEIEGHGTKKINEANLYGGAPLAAQTVSDLLQGVPIDRYVRINLQGIEKLIDALGGVTVYVPKDMKYNDFSQHLYINLKAGKQHLNGEKAIQFLRFRHDGFGDIGRVQRQQMLMRAVIEQALKPQVILKIPEILAVIQTHIDTNLTGEELIALAGFAGQTQRENLQMLMLPGNFNGDGRQGVSYWLPNKNQINTMVSQHFDQVSVKAENLEETPLKIFIQNSTGEEKVSQEMVRYLSRMGYSNVHIAEANSEPLQVTKILAQNGDKLSAQEMKNLLGVGEVLVESTGNIGSDITIQIGADWQAKYSQDNP